MRDRFVALVLCAAATAVSATTQHASPRNAATTVRRGGSNAPSPLDDLRSSLKELRAQAPITHGLLHTLLVTFVAAQHPRTQGLLRGHAVCCRQALRRGRAHVLLSHAVVTHDPYQLVFSIFALVVMAKPAEASLGTANFAKLALCSAVGGAAAAAAFDGQGYVLGPITGDHWFVYVADQCERPAASATERTINIMMFDLGEDVRDAFYLKPGEKGDLRSAARAMTARSGLGALIPSSSHLDDHAFAPCGYSMNALCFESYTTVHVTPEASCSYASFETNTALKGYASLVKNVLAVFKPKKVVLTLFADEAGLAELPKHATFDGLPKLDINPLGTYHRNDLSLLHVEHDCVCMMANYSLHDKNSPHKRRDSPYRDVDRAGHVGSLQ